MVVNNSNGSSGEFALKGSVSTISKFLGTSIDKSLPNCFRIGIL